MENKLHIKYPNIDGLEISNNVMLKGYKVGEVTNIQLLEDSVLVGIQLIDTLKIPVNSTFTITNHDLLGTKGVSLKLSDNHVFYQPNDTIVGKLELSIDELIKNVITDSTLTPLLKEIKDVINVADSLDLINRNK